MSIFLLPKSHQHKVKEYYQNSMGYWIILNDKYKNPFNNSNTIHEYTEKELMKVLRKVGK